MDDLFSIIEERKKRIKGSSETPKESVEKKQNKVKGSADKKTPAASKTTINDAKAKKEIINTPVEDNSESPGTSEDSGKCLR